jgi:hypothetical protein
MFYEIVPGKIEERKMINKRDTKNQERKKEKRKNKLNKAK